MNKNVVFAMGVIISIVAYVCFLLGARMVDAGYRNAIKEGRISIITVTNVTTNVTIVVTKMAKEEKP